MDGRTSELDHPNASHDSYLDCQTTDLPETEEIKTKKRAKTDKVIYFVLDQDRGNYHCVWQFHRPYSCNNRRGWYSGEYIDDVAADDGCDDGSERSILLQTCHFGYGPDFRLYIDRLGLLNTPKACLEGNSNLPRLEGVVDDGGGVHEASLAD